MLPALRRLVVPRRWAAVGVLCAVTAVAAALRLVAAGGDLWLDEVWSIRLAASVRSPIDIFTRLAADNNHYLNTLYLYLVGVERSALVYRLPAILAGSLAVLLAGAIAARRGPVARFTAMTLTASSYLMVHYSSEARGYALAVLCALAACFWLLRYFDQERHRWAIFFSVGCGLGFLCHPTFLYFYLAAGYWSLTQLVSRRTAWPALAARMALCHALPVTVAAVIYLVDLRFVEMGGGPDYVLGPLLLQTGSLAVGGPAWGAGTAAGSLLFVMAVVGGTVVLRRSGDGLWKLLAAAAGLPLLLSLVVPAPFMFARYFLIGIVFALLLATFSLAWLYERGRWGRLAYAVLLATFVAANLTHLARLYQHGRGQYRAALAYMAAADSAAVVTVGSNHDHGVGMLVEHYRRQLAAPRRVVYVPYDAAAWRRSAPRWLVLHHYAEQGPAPYQESYVVHGHRYRLAKVFDSAILSGWQWYCYRQAPPAGLLAARRPRN